MADDTQLCNNCKRDISTANFVMHEIHCRRHIVLCPHCNEPIPKIELEQHFNELHAKIPCEKCLKDIPKEKMSQHLADECVKKLVHCQYCDLSFPKDEIVPHLDYCGSRTECCPLCQQYVMLKDMMRHESSGCTYPEPKPIPRTPTDIFSMEELQQLLSGPDYGVMDELFDGRMQGFNLGASRSNLFPAEPVNNDLIHANRKGDSKKTDVNVQRQRNLNTEPSESTIKSIPPDIEYDAMLAMQLAQEDWEQDHLDLDIDSDMAAHLPPPVNDQSNINKSFGIDKWRHLQNNSLDPHPSVSYFDNSTGLGGFREHFLSKSRAEM